MRSLLGRSARRRALVGDLRATPLLIEALVGSFPVERALDLLPGQSNLLAPAKLIPGAAGQAALLVEIPRNAGSNGCEGPLRDAVDAACAWLDGRRRRNGRGAKGPIDLDALDSTLADLPWSWEIVAGGVRRVHVTGDTVDCRVEVSAAAGVLRLAIAPTAIPVEGEGPGEAIRRFALEANGALRLVRLTIGESSDSAVVAEWDVILPAGLAFARGIERAFEALVGGRAETLRSLRTLGCAPVARRYMELRAWETTPSRRGENTRP